MKFSPQFGRSISLQLVSTSDFLDLSGLRIRFQVSASDVETPNTLTCRVYNLRDETVQLAIQEFSQVILSAGYGDNLGQIFVGTVKQFKRGKERNVDSYLDIFAADGDLAYNFGGDTGILNASIAAGSTAAQQIQKYAQSMASAKPGANITLDPNAVQYLESTGGILPRGKVLFGLARAHLRELANTYDGRWSIQNGVLTFIPTTAYLPGDAVVVNSATGMIGIPESTDQGITVTMLLNPQVRIGRQLQLNNADIAQTTIKAQFFPSYTDFNFVATVDTSTDGIYRVIVVEHEGDTRDQSWLTKAVCLLIDPSAQQGDSIQAFG